MNDLRRDLRAITADGAAYSVMVGVGETYLPAFVLALSANQLASGLVATVPLAIGGALQLGSPYVLRWLRSYRLWVVLCAAVQASVFVPLIVGATGRGMPVILVFALASLYWATGMATGPAWNAWVETLVPRQIRPWFFARRTLASQVGLLCGFVVGGVVLQLAADLDHPLIGFACLFAVAAAARTVSLCCLRSQRELAPPGDDLRLLGVKGLARSLRGEVGLRPLFFMLGMQAAVQIASPYFTPYMFVHLDLSYTAYTVLTCTALVAKIVCLPAFGRAIQRWGPNCVLWAAGLVIAPVPALWLLNDRFAYLMMLQVLAGAAWGAYELAMLLVFFEAVPRERRVSVLTLFNVANAAAIVVGSAGGALMLAWIGTRRETYLALFLASAVARLASLLLLVRMPRFATRTLVVATRPVAVRPQIGSMDRPILPSFEASRELAVLPAASPHAFPSTSGTAPRDPPLAAPVSTTIVACPTSAGDDPFCTGSPNPGEVSMNP